MTVQEMHDYFDFIQDQKNEPYFLDEEKDLAINRAQERFVNDIIFRDILGRGQTPKGVQALYGIEDRLQSDEIIRSLITPNKAVNSDILGTKILYSSIDSKFMHILSIKASSSNTGNITQNKRIKFIRHNDEGAFEDNTFKKGSYSKPYYKIGSDGLYLYPTTGVTENTIISYIFKPTDVELGVTECQLPAYTHEKLVSLALVLAGIATEDEVLIMNDKV